MQTKRENRIDILIDKVRNLKAEIISAENEIYQRLRKALVYAALDEPHALPYKPREVFYTVAKELKPLLKLKRKDCLELPTENVEFPDDALTLIINGYPHYEVIGTILK